MKFLTNNKSKVSATYFDFPSTIEKVVVDIGTDVYRTVKPVIKGIEVDGEIVIENIVQFEIIDDRMSYHWKYEF